MKNLVIASIALLLAFPVVAKEGKGHGSGGERAEHASEKGLEKGKAWGGSKKKEVGIQLEGRSDKKDKKGKKDEQDKKAR